MVSLSPVLLLMLDQTSQTKRSKDDIGTASATGICQQLTSDARWKVAMEFMRQTFRPEASLESSFTFLIHLSPLTGVIRTLREARRAHSKSHAPLFENPIAADLFDLPESRKPIAAISALFGLCMLPRYDRRSTIYSSLYVKDYEYQLYVWEKHQERERNARPESQKSTQIISEYDDLVVNCDDWTLGLRHAQLIGDYQRWTIARSLIQPEQPCPIFELMFIHEVFHVFAANNNTIKSHPVSTFVRRLKEVYGYRVIGTSLYEIVQSHKQWHHANHKLCMQRLQKQLSDPQHCLIRLWIENQCRKLSSWYQFGDKLSHGQRIEALLCQLKDSLLLQATIYVDVSVIQFAAAICLGTLPVAVQKFIHSPTQSSIELFSQNEATTLLIHLQNAFTTAIRMTRPQ